MPTLFRSVGRIEGMLTQFLGMHEAQNKRIEDVERKQDEHGERLHVIEKKDARRMGYAAGVAAVVSMVIGLGGWAFTMFLKGMH